MLSLDKSSGCCNSGKDLSTKISVTSEKKDINLKAFNMIAIKNEAKLLVKHISCDCKCKFNSTSCSSNQTCSNEIFQCKYKSYSTCKKITVGILAQVFVRMVNI